MATSLEKFVGVPLSEASRIAWFGFSADPPTLAHRAIIDAVMGSGIVQKVVVFPAGKLPYKGFKASDWQRMDMVEIWKASADFGDEVVISRFDLLRKEAMSWYELWNSIQKRSVKVQHYLVVGSDQYEEIPRSWDYGKELLKRASFIIVPRKGFDVLPLYENHLLLPIAPLPGSSTDARNGDFSTVDGKVKAYILEQGIYNQ
jgi:nicotinic acid mononucleotide adenylyltransferase